MNFFRDYGLCAIILAMAIVLSSCGVKPTELSQPDGTEPNDFPRHYPMPENGY